MFLKIVHYALFGASPSVRDYMFANGVDRDTVHLNDVKFFKAVIYILVSLNLDKMSYAVVRINRRVCLDCYFLSAHYPIFHFWQNILRI